MVSVQFTRISLKNTTKRTFVFQLEFSNRRRIAKSGVCVRVCDRRRTTLISIKIADAEFFLQIIHFLKK